MRIMWMDKLKWETTLKWHRNKNNSSVTFSYLNDLGKCLFPKLLTKHLRHDSSCPVRLKPSYIVSRTCYHFLIYMHTVELELYRDQPYQVVSGDHSDRWAEAMQALCLLAIAVNRAWVFTASRSGKTSYIKQTERPERHGKFVSYSHWPIKPEKQGKIMIWPHLVIFTYLVHKFYNL